MAATAKRSRSAPKVESGEVRLPPLDIRRIQITLVGDSPLICHAWSTKAKRAMLDKQMKKARQAREAKDPEEDFRASLYILSGDPKADPTTWVCGFPAVGIKAAAVDACSHVADLTKVLARGAFHIDAEYVVIEGTPTIRSDMVRVGMGSADIRFRGEFKAWRTTVSLSYNHSVISPEQIIHLFSLAGFAVGCGEWRPQKNGSYGRFHVATPEDMKP